MTNSHSLCLDMNMNFRVVFMLCCSVRCCGYHLQCQFPSTINARDNERTSCSPSGATMMQKLKKKRCALLFLSSSPFPPCSLFPLPASSSDNDGGGCGGGCSCGEAGTLLCGVYCNRNKNIYDAFYIRMR
jgi:hypothetical protein